MKTIVRFMIFAVGILISITCGSQGESPLDGTATKPADAVGRQAIQSEDWAAAIAAYKSLVDAGSTDYTNHLGLAVAYAGSICIEILNLVGATDGENSAIATAGGVNSCTEEQGAAGTCCYIAVPSSYDNADADVNQINYKSTQIQLAVGALNSIPEANRADANIASSFTTHYGLFNLLAAQILQTKYTQLSSITVNDLTDEDAEALVAFLEAGGSLEGGVFSESINEQLSQIESMPGATTAEQVKAYMNQ